jgi:hypothetical protein
VLAVDEQLRYTGLKAGYHGGASPAEAVIPISILVNGAPPAGLGLDPVPATVPLWWNPPPVNPEPTPATPQPLQPRVTKKAARPVHQTPTLFDEEAAATPTELSHPSNIEDPVAKLLRSSLFSQQFQTYGRNLHKRQLAALLRETITAGGVLALGPAARLLGVKATRINGALSVVAQVLNTDGVEVLIISGNELQLRSALMFEQFGVPETDVRR